MISDFEALSQKVDELARLAHALRRENAGLRASLAMSAAEKDELARRMQLAQQRVAVLLERLPGGSGWIDVQKNTEDDTNELADAVPDADRLAEMP